MRIAYPVRAAKTLIFVYDLAFQALIMDAGNAFGCLFNKGL